MSDPQLGVPAPPLTPSAAIALRSGTVLSGQYRVERVLGQGGFGVTYLAHDRMLDNRCAVKEFLPLDVAGRSADGTSVTPHTEERADWFRQGLVRFLDEARTLARLNHPQIVRVRNFIEAHGTGYLVMDYLDGETLSAHVARFPNGRMPAPEAADLVIAVLRGLEIVHAAGLVHRDIKPDNIYMTADGLPVLLDFGAARLLVAGQSHKTVTAVLTPGYAPIEQYGGKGQGPWSDVYACAATLYRLITGQRPPDATDRMDEDDLVPVGRLTPGVPAGLAEAIHAGLSVRRQDRPQDARTFAGMLARGRDSAPVILEPTAPAMNSARTLVSGPSGERAASPVMASISAPVAPSTPTVGPRAPSVAPTTPEPRGAPVSDSFGGGPASPASTPPAPVRRSRLPLVAAVVLVAAAIAGGAYAFTRPGPAPVPVDSLTADLASDLAQVRTNDSTGMAADVPAGTVAAVTEAAQEAQPAAGQGDPAPVREPATTTTAARRMAEPAATTPTRVAERAPEPATTSSSGADAIGAAEIRRAKAALRSGVVPRTSAVTSSTGASSDASSSGTADAPTSLVQRHRHFELRFRGCRRAEGTFACALTVANVAPNDRANRHLYVEGADFVDQNGRKVEGEDAMLGDRRQRIRGTTQMADRQIPNGSETRMLVSFPGVSSATTQGDLMIRLSIGLTGTSEALWFRGVRVAR